MIKMTGVLKERHQKIAKSAPYFKGYLRFCYGGGNDVSFDGLKMQYFWNGGSDGDQSCIGAHSGPIRPFLDYTWCFFTVRSKHSAA